MKAWRASRKASASGARPGQGGWGGGWSCRTCWGEAVSLDLFCVGEGFNQESDMTSCTISARIALVFEWRTDCRGQGWRPGDQ